MGDIGIPYGVIINSSTVLLGGAAGFALRNHLPERIRMALPPTFGLVSIAMGVTSVQRISCLPAVVLATIVGTVIGECLQLENRLGNAVDAGLSRITRGREHGLDLVMLVGIIVLFCASGTGIYGAMESRFTGDHSILLTKAVLDFSSSMTFGAILGGVVCCIAAPQFLILLSVYLLAGFVLPYTTPEMVRDFTACGGIIMVGTGLRIGQIKQISVVNMLPAFVLVMPVSYLYTLLPI